MKNTPQIEQIDRRHESDPRTPRHGRILAQTEQGYQSSQLLGVCGMPAKFHPPAFFEISNRYFAEEAPRSFAVDAGVFAILILTAMLPIVNGVEAVSALIRSVGVL
jgi:hypothetical protein